MSQEVRWTTETLKPLQSHFFRTLAFDFSSQSWPNLVNDPQSLYTRSKPSNCVLATLLGNKLKVALKPVLGGNGKEKQYDAMTYGKRLTGLPAHTIGTLLRQGGDDGLDLVLRGSA
jgi:hypothetical protein